MRKKLEAVGTVIEAVGTMIGYLYVLSVCLVSIYFSWLFFQENGFFAWLIFGLFVSTLQAIVWPLYAAGIL